MISIRFIDRFPIRIINKTGWNSLILVLQSNSHQQSIRKKRVGRFLGFHIKNQPNQIDFHKIDRRRQQIIDTPLQINLITGIENPIIGTIYPILSSKMRVIGVSQILKVDRQRPLRSNGYQKLTSHMETIRTTTSKSSKNPTLWTISKCKTLMKNSWECRWNTRTFSSSWTSYQSMARRLRSSTDVGI